MMRRALLAGLLLLALAWASDSQEVENVTCPGGQSQCPDGNTCCELASGGYGCCPLPNAACCNDHVHCCPHGYICDVSGGTCQKGAVSVPWVKKNVAKPIKVENVVCPGGKSACPDGNTCCILASGQYGCCPLPKAVCCSDHLHCCPNGNTCNVAAGTCDKGDRSIPWVEKNVAKPVKVEVVTCPGGQQYCPDGSTCCSLGSGSYGCCPMPKAVCCSDHQHCCPEGYTCDVTGGTCKRQDQNVAWLMQNVAEPSKVNVEGIVCPGSTAVCPTGSTCCKIAKDKWGCCPALDAVCCGDYKHCCAKGQKCDSGRCITSSASTPWLTKFEAKPMKPKESVPWFTKTLARKFSSVGIVQCDATSYCPDGNTCCKLASGEWGCCPYPKAVCCSDKEHCCPQDTTCDIAQGKCDKKLQPLGWTTETLALHVGAGAVQCDATHYCPSGNTCCRLASGAWGCCPVPNAVCCNDHQHCCPSGYTCQTGTGQCTR